MRHSEIIRAKKIQFNFRGKEYESDKGDNLVLPKHAPAPTAIRSQEDFGFKKSEKQNDYSRYGKTYRRQDKVEFSKDSTLQMTSRQAEEREKGNNGISFIPGEINNVRLNDNEYKIQEVAQAEESQMTKEEGEGKMVERFEEKKTTKKIEETQYNPEKKEENEMDTEKKKSDIETFKKDEMECEIVILNNDEILAEESVEIVENKNDPEIKTIPDGGRTWADEINGGRSICGIV